jgi:CarD family transcriptional regulator
MFSVGHKVIHFAQGAGVITDKREMQITETSKCYLVIDMIGSDSTLMIPADKAEQRLRPVCKRTALRRLLTSELADEPKKLPKDYKKRKKHIESKLKSGETKEWVEVVRDLTHRDEQKSLSTGDRKLLDRAVDLLSGELALAQGIDQEEAVSRLTSMVEHRSELVDQQAEDSSWWRKLEQRVREPFAKSSADTA